jgi:predicted Zn finger-like uncharacterized protein
MLTTICASSPGAVHRRPADSGGRARQQQMILSCAVCHTRYLVGEEALRGRAGRTVRCANCGHTWHQKAPPELPVADDRARSAAARIEPALEVPPRPAGVHTSTMEVSPRGPSLRRRRRHWGAIRWLLLAVLLALAIVAGLMLARGAVVAIWPPAARLYALVGAQSEPLGAGLKIDKLTPTRTSDGLIIEGDITNTGKTVRDVPRLRVALRDGGEKEVQFKVIDPPQPRLSPGAVVHFKTPFEHPYDVATGVVVTFTAR